MMTTLSRTLRRTVVTIGVASLLLGADAGRAGASCSGQPLVGRICTFALNFCPPTTLPADGRLLGVKANPRLFAVIGTTYGGNGTMTFALPDLRSRTVVGGVGPVGQTAGDATTVGLRLDNVSGGVAVPATQSPFIGLTRCVVGDGSVAEAQDTFVGEVMAFAGNFCPSGYLRADGTVLSIADNANAALFTVLGTTFGGDGQSTFALPNLVGAAVAGTGEGPGRPNVVLGQTGGTTNTVGVETAAAKSVDVPQTQSPSMVVTLCVAQSGVVSR